MSNFNPRQFIFAVLVVSIATSFLVSLLTISFLTGEKPAQVVERIIEKTPGGKITEREVSERVLRQEELVVGVVKRASPAVVSIVATKDVPVIEQFFIDPFGGDPFFERFFGEGFRVPQFRQKGTEKKQTGAGTGFIVSENGLILTNKHVVADGSADYTVFLSDGAKFPAKVLGRDPVQDLAVLKIDKSGLPAVAVGNSSEIEIGQTVVAIGNALGEFSNTVSVGIVSGLHRNIVAGGGGAREALEELIQTDAAINPGNSGGPLLNLRGEVIGINTAIAQGAENIGFAIPANRAKRAIESVKTSGRIIYPFLGVNYVMVTKEVQEVRKLAVDYGALLVGVEGRSAVVAGSPADQAGLRDGDIILEFDGERVAPPKTLASLIQSKKVGDTVTLKARRGSETLTLKATLEERK